MSNKKVRALPIALWSACILWVLFIFINSMQTGSESGQMSGNVTEAINDVLHLISPSWNVGHRFVRKAAHFSEFALLALLFGFAYLPTFIPDIGGRVPLKRLYCVLWAFPSAVLVAVVDETIQLFVEGRSGSVVDVMIDASGAACSVLVFFMTLVLINRKKNME
jgi:VanZ family protein